MLVEETRSGEYRWIQLAGWPGNKRRVSAQQGKLSEPWAFWKLADWKNSKVEVKEDGLVGAGPCQL